MINNIHTHITLAKVKCTDRNININVNNTIGMRSGMIFHTRIVIYILFICH